MCPVRKTAYALIGVGLIALTGCSTARKARGQNWIDIFTPQEDQTITSDCSDYGADRLEKDYLTLMRLSGELESLADEMARMRRTLIFKETPYLTEEENKEVEILLFRFANARDALLDIVHYYRECSTTDLQLHTKGAVIGMAAGLGLSYYSSRFIAFFTGHKDLIKLFNTPHHRYEIPAGMYDKVYDSVTSLDHLETIDVAWYLFSKELANPKSNLAKVRDADSKYRELIAEMDGLHADTHIQTEYVLQAGSSVLPEVKNRLHHSRIAAVGDSIGNKMGSGMYKTRGVIFRDVARIKNPRAQLLQFSSDQVLQIKEMLQPGDILFTYTAGYMSNVFLPGQFKHGITYLGTVEDRRRAGLTVDELSRRAVSDVQRKALIEHVNVEETPDGREVDIIEAVAEGVIMNSLEELLATHVNRLAVIRPVITEEERLDQLVALMQYIGSGYDFKFDFQDTTYQCCTELIYRTTNQKGAIDFSLVRMKGRWILAADDVLRYYLSQNPAAFEFVLLAEQGSDPNDHEAVIRTGSQGLQSLYSLMNVKKAEKQ